MCLCAVKAPARLARGGAPALQERATRAWRSDVARRFSPPTTKVGRPRRAESRAPAALIARNGFERTAASTETVPTFHARSRSAPCVAHSPPATHTSRTSTMAGLGDMAGLGATLPDRDGGGKKKGGDSDDEDPDVRPRELARLCVMPHPETTRRFRLRIAHLSSRLAPSKRTPPGRRRGPRRGRSPLAADAPVQTPPRRATSRI